MLTIKQITPSDLYPSMLDTFNRNQETSRVLVNENGSLVEKEDHFKDKWSLTRKREIVQHFRDVTEGGGAVIIANMDTTVVGFAVIESEVFGDRSRYRELSYIHVSSEHRGNGIGRKLFNVVTNVAKQLGAEKLYIGAHPSIETQRFYFSMGCVLAEEMNEDIYNREPLDLQLEYTL
ncbi:GNAT family N-acetyltransferase [Alkalihalobacillus sp. CinArs1]|uniref:GNAT family N-acetyltransferase n=1 Tax=Alkalihalobacillus sp. CinArs1 TaxID=2995314 RepID=UPI0022DDAB92|nr:GNAT family N-acetyltransferase [Alkalihalobacillus sp. CinArs1]